MTVERRRKRLPRRVLRSIAATVCVATFVGWAYVASIAIVHPTQLPHQVNHELAVRNDIFAMICFAVSALSHLTMGLLDDRI